MIADSGESRIEYGTLPETDEGTTYAVIIVRSRDDDETEGKAQGNCEEAVHRQ